MIQTWLIVYITLGSALLAGYLIKTHYDIKLINSKLKNSPKRMPDIYSHIDKDGKMQYHVIGGDDDDDIDEDEEEDEDEDKE